MLRSLLLLTVGAAVASAGTLRTDPAPPEAAAAVAVAAAAWGFCHLASLKSNFG